MDIFTKKQRSRLMSKIRSSGTRPELSLKKILRGKGFAYHPKIKGNPDFANRKKKIAIFVHGCFWHKCPKHYQEPASNKDYWVPKIERNLSKDKENKMILKNHGYKTITIWEHEIKTQKIPKKISRALSLIPIASQ